MASNTTTAETTANDQVNVPPAVADLIASATAQERSYADVHKQLKEANWMTEELYTSIAKYYPTVHDIEKDTGKRNQDSLDIACKSLFPVGRKFASSYQLTQCVHHLLKE